MCRIPAPSSKVFLPFNSLSDHPALSRVFLARLISMRSLPRMPKLLVIISNPKVISRAQTSCTDKRYGNRVIFRAPANPGIVRDLANFVAVSCGLMPSAQIEIKLTCKNELGKPKDRRGVGFAERTDWTGSPRGELDRILGDKTLLEDRLM